MGRPARRRQSGPALLYSTGSAKCRSTVVQVAPVTLLLHKRTAAARKVAATRVGLQTGTPPGVHIPGLGLLGLICLLNLLVRL